MIIRRRLITSAACLVLTAGLLAACTSTSQPVTLQATDSGSSQTLAVGQKLEIELPSNPTTGYRWDVDGTLPPVLEQVGEAQHETTSTALGAGGVDRWTFTGKATGEGTLKLKYWRSFEPTVAPVDTFEVDVTVR